VVVEGNHEISFPASKTEIVIGREDPVSQIFPEVDLTPFGGETGGVSRQHARIIKQGSQWSIIDLNSTNFTHVNGKRLEPNVPTPIKDGAQIRFGRVSTIFKE
jgi:pSer/pThr/pTyr-binding forkhead associated (FHA) protein